MTPSNSEIVRSAYEAFSRGDVPAVLSILAEDITWHVPGRSPVGGDCTGHDEVVGLFVQLGERSGGTFGIDVVDVLDNGTDKVVVLHTESADLAGGRLDTVAMHLWCLQDGKATSFRGFHADDYTFDQLWS